MSQFEWQTGSLLAGFICKAEVDGNSWHTGSFLENCASAMRKETLVFLKNVGMGELSREIDATT